MKNTEKKLKIEVEGNKYTLEKSHRDCFDLEEFIDTYTDYFNPFDYIVGDYSYDKLRLKGFYKSDNKNDKDNKPYPYDRRCRGSEGRTADNRS